MGHYDDLFQRDQRNKIILNKRRFVEMVHNCELDCLLDAAEVSCSPTVSVKKEHFELILDIIRDLEPEKYTPQW